MNKDEEEARRIWEEGYEEGQQIAKAWIAEAVGTAAGVSRATATSDVALIRDLPLPKDTMDALIVARYGIEKMNDQVLDILEASPPGTPRSDEFDNVSTEVLRSFIARERLVREAKAEKSKVRVDRVITIVGFAVTILAVGLAALLD